jgi:hypothetical protein
VPMDPIDLNRSCSYAPPPSPPTFLSYQHTASMRAGGGGGVWALRGAVQAQTLLGLAALVF